LDLARNSQGSRAFFCPEAAEGKEVTRKSKRPAISKDAGLFCLLTSQGDGFLNCQHRVHQKSENSNKKMPANLSVAGQSIHRGRRQFKHTARTKYSIPLTFGNLSTYQTLGGKGGLSTRKRSRHRQRHFLGRRKEGGTHGAFCK
jgi:hypothetical protein